MNIFAELPYFKITRKITWNQQHTVEEVHHLALTKNIIVSDSEEFMFQDIHDISHRQMSEETGVLYLHTNRGVFSFFIKTNPTDFIDTYKNLKAST